ncbi:hypothetical protein ID866_11590 [Astraeus odoratus]|nr:hypothetical protein ID866_11590 [Astraeus odoratus]
MIRSVAFSPDGTRIISGSFDKTVRVWDAERGVQIGSPLEGHTDWVTSVAFSSDGTRITSGSHDKTVRVWDAERGVQIGSPLEGHTDVITSLAFSPDGTRTISGSSDKTVRVWDAERSVQIGSPLEGHTDGFRSVVFSPDTSHALYNAHWVLHTLPYKSHVSTNPVKLHEDGWIRVYNKLLLLWIPPALQRPFYSMHTIMVIPKGGCAELDLSKMTHGTEWQNCFKVTL